SPTDLAHFAMLSRGNCWLSVEGIAEPIPLTGGDCFLLAKGTSIVLRDSLRTRPRWSFREIGAKANGNVALCGGGGAPTSRHLRGSPQLFAEGKIVSDVVRPIYPARLCWLLF